MKTKNSNSLMSLSVLIIFFLTLLMTSPAYSVKPSFDCSKATTKVERAICRSPREHGLSTYDNTMSALYNRLYEEFDEQNKAALKIDQKEWLKLRDKCGEQSNIDTCLYKTIKKRIAELTKRLENLPLSNKEKYAGKRGMYVLIQKSYYMKYTNSKLGEIFEKNLNSFADEPPMVCGCKISPNIAELSYPNWKPVNAINYLYFIKKHFMYKKRNYAKFKKTTIEYLWKKDKPELLNKISKNELSAWEAYFDIDNDGNVEHVIRMTIYDCDPENEGSYNTGPYPFLFVKNDKNNSLDMENKVFHWPKDAFFYKEKTYFARWHGFSGFKNGGIDIGHYQFRYQYIKFN